MALSKQARKDPHVYETPRNIPALHFPALKTETVPWTGQGSHAFPGTPRPSLPQLKRSRNTLQDYNGDLDTYYKDYGTATPAPDTTSLLPNSIYKNEPELVSRTNCVGASPTCVSRSGLEIVLDQ